jgi:hypothetical protein
MSYVSETRHESFFDPPLLEEKIHSKSNIGKEDKSESARNSPKTRIWQTNETSYRAKTDADIRNISQDSDISNSRVTKPTMVVFRESENLINVKP